MTTDESETGWDSLAEEFGLPAETTAPKAEQPAPSKPATRPTLARPAREPQPEVEAETDDFGAGIAPEPPSHAALYDPGPDALAEDAEEFDDAAPEPLEDEDESEEAVPGGDGGVEGEGGKRRRRRRRRKKKGGPGAPEPGATESPDVEEDDDVVEQGEAPAEVESDDDEPATPSAVEEELEAEVAGPRPEWHVMTWMELVSKLHRPS